MLTDWLHVTGTGVILFDEIDKAHPDVHDLILGLLDTGRIMSAKGEKLDARQCVIVLTTNAVKHADLPRESIGFARNVELPELEDVLEDHFPRELLGRLDEQILFNPLSDSISFAEVLNSSDVPGGVVNILTGKKSELYSHMASHMDVNSIIYCGDDEKLIKSISELASGNIKRTVFFRKNDWV